MYEHNMHRVLTSGGWKKVLIALFLELQTTVWCLLCVLVLDPEPLQNQQVLLTSELSLSAPPPKSNVFFLIILSTF